ncbi:MAG: serine protease, partial [Fibrobacter sp.]|nr:serine protease [Fibrobacter sp.]
MTNNIIIPILLQILGAAVIIAEFLVPSMGILTVTAIGLIGYSLYMVFTTVSVTAGFVFVFIDILFLPILVIVGIKLLAASP